MMESEEWIGNMDALLFAMVFEVALLQLTIHEGSTELRCRFSKISNKSERLQRNKLVNDREMVRNVIRETLVEVAEHGHCRALACAVHLLDKRLSSAATLRLTFEKLRITREAVTEDLHLKRIQWTQDLQNADQKVAYLRDKLKDDFLNVNTRLLYTDKWLSARAEALEERCLWRPQHLPRLDHEQRVHCELSTAFQLQIKEREDALEHWRFRYADDTARMNEQLARQRELFLEAVGHREELQQLFDLHDGEMRGWLNFKRERAARLAREERLRMAAQRLQAWWRGVMVRRALGQFRYLKNAKKTPAKSKKK